MCIGNIWDDMKEYQITEVMAENVSVCHMKTNAGPLLHGGGIGEEANTTK